MARGPAAAELFGTGEPEAPLDAAAAVAGEATLVPIRTMTSLPDTRV